MKTLRKNTFLYSVLLLFCFNIPLIKSSEQECAVVLAEHLMEVIYPQLIESLPDANQLELNIQYNVIPDNNLQAVQIHQGQIDQNSVILPVDIPVALLTHQFGQAVITEIEEFILNLWSVFHLISE